MKQALITPKHRAVLSETLPYEIPPSFDNGGFYRFISNYEITLIEEQDKIKIQWKCNSDEVDSTIKLIFNTEDAEASQKEGFRKASLAHKALVTIPFHFEIAHKEQDSRRLSLIHPRNQLQVALFYERYSSLITYYASLSPFSLRKPTRVAKAVIFEDYLNRKLKSALPKNIEESHKEYDQMGSYFSYEKYSNIYRFYESYEYQKSERKYGKLLKLDIGKCFESIYTHSLPWAILGNQATKDNLGKSKKTFGGQFDALMQCMNCNETNGILIGPEFSRIFTELILQCVDNELRKRLFHQKQEWKHKVDYEVYRYVDDYFVFFRDDEFKGNLEKTLNTILREFKMSLNTHKSFTLERPIITGLSIAKHKIQKVFHAEIKKEYKELSDNQSSEKVEEFIPKVSANNLIIEFKSLLKETGTTYKETINYTFSLLEKEFDEICEKFRANKYSLDKVGGDFSPSSKVLVKALIGLFEFAFFIYSAEPRINFSIRLTRSICLVVDKLSDLGVKTDLKSRCFKFIHDNVTDTLKLNHRSERRDIETLYLIHALNKLGANYRLHPELLAEYFHFTPIDDSPSTYEAPNSINIFSITTLLLFIRNSNRYQSIKDALELAIEKKIKKKKPYIHEDTESLLLYLDLIVCPYLSDGLKTKLSNYFSIEETEIESIISTNDYWFTNWKNFDLSFELDKKRMREVY